MLTLFQSPMFIVFASLTIVAVAVTIAEAWTKTKKASLDAELKLEMVRQGMSADEICRVIQAKPSKNRDAKHTTADQV